MEKAFCQKNLIRIIPAVLAFLFQSSVYSQTLDTLNAGAVSFTSSKNIYIRFPQTKSIKVGDTLYVRKEADIFPAIVVTNKSSSSCVGLKLSSDTFKLGDQIFFKFQPAEKPEPKPKNQLENQEKSEGVALTETAPKHSEPDKKIQTSNLWKGRLSAASYSYLGDISSSNSTRFQYTLSLQGNKLAGGKLYLDSYVSMRYRTDEWEQVTHDLGTALKVYSLAATYEFNKNNILSLGRKINANLSNMGAIDGIQFEKKLHAFSIGCAVGSRPNISDYGYNLNLLQAGIYVHHELSYHQDHSISHTVAVVEQQNHGQTDRRFLYIQHSSNLFRKLSLFGSSEIDMYAKIHDTVKSNFNLTNLYLNLRYRLLKNLSVSGSYDARTNVIYYETYKNDIDRLLDEETRKGLRFQINYQPIRFVSISAGTNLRFQNSGGNTSKNYNIYLSHYRIPLLLGSLTLSGNYLTTDYLKSRVEGIQFSKDIFNGKLYFDLYYRRVNYTYLNFEYTSTQHLSGLSVNLRVNKMLTMGVYSEYTSEPEHSYLRLNGRIMLRI